MERVKGKHRGREEEDYRGSTVQGRQTGHSKGGSNAGRNGGRYTTKREVN